MSLVDSRNHHRMPIQEWMNAMALGDEAWFKSIPGQQAIRMRDSLAPLFNRYDHDRTEEIGGYVVSTHTSKSQKLPVVEFQNELLLVRYRDNFHNNIISVEISDDAMLAGPEPRFYDLFDPDHEVHDCYAEGFDKSWVHGSYNADPHHKFTVEVTGLKEAAWAFMWILTRTYPVEKTIKVSA